MRGDLQVDVIFTKITGDKRTDTPYKNITEKEKEERGLDFGKRFFEALGFTVTEKTAG